MGRKRRRFHPREFANSLSNNIEAFYFFQRKIFLMATSCFKWNGLPETVNETFLERMLLTHGSVLFFKSDELGYLALPSVGMDKLDIYNIPYYRKAYAVSGKNFYRNETNSVLMFDNNLMSSEMCSVQYFASELAEICGVRRINLNAQKTPILLECDENERTTTENLYAQYEEGRPVIKGRKGVAQPVSVLKTEAPYLVDKMDAHEQFIWERVAEYYGIKAVNKMKKERMNVQEVDANLGVTETLGEGRLHQRQLAAEQINLLFPELNVSVEWLGGGEDGNLYDGGEDGFSDNGGEEAGSAISLSKPSHCGTSPKSIRY